MNKFNLEKEEENVRGRFLQLCETIQRDFVGDRVSNRVRILAICGILVTVCSNNVYYVLRARLIFNRVKK